MNPDGLGWFVLRTKANALEVACENLARQGYETLMPRQEVTMRTRRGLRRTWRALFPGYVFLGARTEAINWTSVRSTRGVSAVVTQAGGVPARLPAAVVDAMQQATDDDGRLTIFAPLRPGDRVSVLNGPGAGWLAEVVAADAHDRVRLLVDMMGRQVPVSVTRQDVEPRR